MGETSRWTTSCGITSTSGFAGSASRSPTLATLDVEIAEERNPSIADSQVAEATLRLKGVTLRAHEASPQMAHTIHELAEDIRRQVKKHREMRRKRTRTRRAVNRMRGRTA